MKKLLLLLLFASFTSIVQGYEYQGSLEGGLQGGYIGGKADIEAVKRLMPYGLTFYKDFTKLPIGTYSGATYKEWLNADFSIGSPLATFTSTSGSFTITSAGYQATTANDEVLKYLISNNRTAAQETIVIKFTPSVSAVDLAQSAYLTETVIKGRIILLSSIGDDLAFQPNGADSGVALMRTGSGLRPLMNVTYIACAIAMASTGNPNMGLYVDNTSYDSTTQLNTDWTVPAWGSFFTIGCNSGSAFQLNGVISSIALFNRSLSSTEVLALNKLM